MESEILNVFNEHHQPIGTATREDVHLLGLWHETFHCWFIGKKNGQDILYLQLRSPMKKDYPNVLDITAAGHLLATESVQDGVREVQEETGIDIAFNDLYSLGIIPYSITKRDMKDNELAHVYVYRSEYEIKDFHLQSEEVAGISKVAFKDFTDLWGCKCDTIPSRGFVMNEEKQNFLQKRISRADFVPHPVSYYEAVIRGIEKVLSD
ncbi:NUDIX hydrolase [Sporosarcina sp. A2]|uniref:NUDIX hydrolase n=1 Tax=Sporosarcina sp. A2 TaxID=3393449 RepID=UPI003D7AE3B4